MCRFITDQICTRVYKVAAIFLVTAALGVSSGCAAPKRGTARAPEPRLPRAIDVHMHIVSEPPWGKESEREKRIYSAPVEERAKLLQREMEAAGVAVVFLMGHLESVNRNNPLGINENLKIASLVPGARIIGAVDPREGLNEAHMAAVRKQLTENRGNVVALKCYLGYRGGPEDPGYQPYYRLAEECNLPVVFHTGDTWDTKGDVRLAHPLGVDRVATQYPKLRIVLAHVGVPWHLDAAEVAWKNNNVWLDLSGLLLGDDQSVGQMLEASCLPDVVPGLVIRDLTDALGFLNRYDRLLYGTNWPVISCSMANYRRFMEAVIPQEHHQKVFCENAEELFGVKASQIGE